VPGQCGRAISPAQENRTIIAGFFQDFTLILPQNVTPQGVPA
jgi:hypothetical protein